MLSIFVETLLFTIIINKINKINPLYMYTLSSQTIYDEVKQRYINIYVLDRKPTGDLEKIVRPLRVSKLSPFQDTHDDNCRPCKCSQAVYNPHQSNEFLCIDDIAILFTWLLEHDYTIDTSLTQMMNDSTVRFKKRFVCFIGHKHNILK